MLNTICFNIDPQNDSHITLGCRGVVFGMEITPYNEMDYKFVSVCFNDFCLKFYIFSGDARDLAEYAICSSVDACVKL